MSEVAKWWSCQDFSFCDVAIFRKITFKLFRWSWTHPFDTIMFDLSVSVARTDVNSIWRRFLLATFSLSLETLLPVDCPKKYIHSINNWVSRIRDFLGESCEEYFLGHLKHPFKIAISGNHECTFDESFLKSSSKPTESYSLMNLSCLQIESETWKRKNWRWSKHFKQQWHPRRCQLLRSCSQMRSIWRIKSLSSLASQFMEPHGKDSFILVIRNRTDIVDKPSRIIILRNDTF